MSGSVRLRCHHICFLKLEGHPVKLACELLNVSTSRFYEYFRGKATDKDKRDGELKSKILSIFSKSKETYGSPRIQKSLQRSGEKVGKNRVARLMKEEGLRARGKKAFRPKTTINNPNDKKSPRIFKVKESQAVRENEYWLSDMTYLSTGQNFSYLVVVMDLYNRQIKGWDISDSMNAENTRKALLEALKTTSGKLKELTFHSDQGVQYCFSEVRNKLKFLNITQSMSRKGNCYDNAFVESFFHTLKNELEKTKFNSLEEARKMIFEYINWYNRERLHSSLGYLSPLDYVKETNRLAA